MVNLEPESKADAGRTLSRRSAIGAAVLTAAIAIVPLSFQPLRFEAHDTYRAGLLLVLAVVGLSASSDWRARLQRMPVLLAAAGIEALGRALGARHRGREQAGRQQGAAKHHRLPSGLSIVGSRHAAHAMAHLSAAEDMDVKMKDKLAAIGAMIGDDAVALGLEPEFLRDPRHGAPEADQELGLLGVVLLEPPSGLGRVFEEVRSHHRLPT